MPDVVRAQTAQPPAATIPIPPVTVEANPAPKKKPAGKKAAAKAPSAPVASAPKPDAPVKTPDLSLTVPAADGSAAEGYRALFATDVGPLGNKAILDTPYAISAVSKDLIENTQSHTTDDIFRMHPFIFNMFPATRDNPMFPMIRGFDASGATRDNMRLWNTGYVHVEGLERVEVINGATGFLYGPTPPGGFINYVQKNPTAKPFLSTTAGVIDDSNAYAHLDVGGPIDAEGKLSYRFNAVGQKGETSIDGQDIERYFFSGAVDWQPSNDFLVQVRAYDGSYRANGQQPFWNFFGTARYPDAPDASKLWGQPWGYAVDKETGANVRVKWNLNDTFTLRAGYSYIDGYTEFLGINNNVGSNSGTFEQDAIANSPGYLTTQSGYVAMDASFTTGPLNHKLTVGFSGLDYRNATANDPFAFIVLGTNFTYNNPTYVPMPSYSIGTTEVSTYFTRGNRNLFIGDTIDFGPHWSAIVGATRSTVLADVNNYIPPAGQPRTLESSYDESHVSPTASLIFKPQSWLSFYGTYMEGLEEGGVAGTWSANPGTIMSPFVSTQYEVGSKMTLGGTLLTLAAFDITRGYSYYDSQNFYVDGGSQRNKGIEVGLSGKVTDNLSVFSGATWIDAEVESDLADITGKVPVNVPDQMYKIYAEYALPGVPGLALTGGIVYQGEFAAFAANEQFLPAVTTGDLGFRYETVANGVPLITRFNVTNVTDESYWMSQRFIGAPRTFALTLEAKLN